MILNDQIAHVHIVVEHDINKLNHPSNKSSSIALSFKLDRSSHISDA
jgi:hypothetical protein